MVGNYKNDENLIDNNFYSAQSTARLVNILATNPADVAKSSHDGSNYNSAKNLDAQSDKVIIVDSLSKGEDEIQNTQNFNDGQGENENLYQQNNSNINQNAYETFKPSNIAIQGTVNVTLSFV